MDVCGNVGEIVGVDVDGTVCDIGGTLDRTVEIISGIDGTSGGIVGFGFDVGGIGVVGGLVGGVARVVAK